MGYPKGKEFDLWIYVEQNYNSKIVIIYTVIFGAISTIQPIVKFQNILMDKLNICIQDLIIIHQIIIYIIILFQPF